MTTKEAIEILALSPYVDDRSRDAAKVVCQELTRLQEKMKELEEKTYCAYCGAVFLFGKKEATRAVTDHIYTCKEHPVYQLTQRVKTLEEGIFNLAEKSLLCPVSQQVHVDRKALNELYGSLGIEGRENTNG